MGSQLELCVVGSVALDTVETARERRANLLGGSASYVTFAASFFVERSRLVACVGNDFAAEHVELLRSRGVDLEGLEIIKSGRTFHWSGRYAPDFSSRESLDTQLNVFSDFRPKLPESYRDAELVFLGNIDPTLQLEVLSQVRKPALVALDTMNFWISGKLAELKTVLGRIDAILLNDEEARQLSGEHALPSAVRAISAMGPKIVIIKRGEHGALMWQDGHVFASPAFPIAEVVDPTGAGDSFAGAFMGYLAEQGKFDGATLRRAVIYGSTVASFTVEGFSLDRLRTISRAEVEDRYRQFRAITAF